MQNPVDKKPADNRNLMIALLLSALVLVGYDYLRLRFSPPAEQTQETVQQAPAAAAPGAPTLNGDLSAVSSLSATPAGDVPHIGIKSSTFEGTLSLKGGRIDSLKLPDYKVSLKDQTPVTMFTTTGERVEFFEAGWLSDVTAAPNSDTVWSAGESDVLNSLTPDTPVTLTWDNGKGQVFQRSYILDAGSHTIRIIDGVTNQAEHPVRLAHYAQLHRAGYNKRESTFYNFNGLQAFFDSKHLTHSYEDIAKKGPFRESGRQGWVGVSDPYFLSALLPDQTNTQTAVFRNTKTAGADFYTLDLQGPAVVVEPGQYVENAYRLYVGPKKFSFLSAEKVGLDQVIDYGWYHIIAKMFFDALKGLHSVVGNWGVSIIIMTFILKLVMFPLATKSYRSMSEMKKLQPKMEQLRERYGEDREKLAQEMMALYRHHRINPMSGCWPMLIQIPIFFAFYKVILISFEFRQAPFVGWIHDLSVSDPYFVLPILMGLTMIVQQRLNPPAADPVQQKVLQFMPVMFTFMFLWFPAGLVLYWTTNSILSVSQQWWIMRRMGVK
ncbi:MAG: membrane protein insertase YidC [Proteobacteria bacterium]|nr:membrane protein insertase YidC [Pseudomonadota bacterium]